MRSHNSTVTTGKAVLWRYVKIVSLVPLEVASEVAVGDLEVDLVLAEGLGPVVGSPVVEAMEVDTPLVAGTVEVPVADMELHQPLSTVVPLPLPIRSQILRRPGAREAKLSMSAMYVPRHPYKVTDC